MESGNEDKLIINGEMFFSIRKYIRQNKPSAEIIEKIEEVLKEGADINACDSNDNNNTVLHIAAQKGDKDVVLYLLQKGAHLFRNKHDKTAADLALQSSTVIGKEIAQILSQKGKPAAHIKGKNRSNQQEESKQNHQVANITTTSTDEEIMYPKRAGTSGVSGQFYETKLLSLVLHRALHDQEIENFYLAANIKYIGDFDDVCFRYSNVACFMQTKHRENTDKAKLTVACVRSRTGKLGLGTYFDSFLKIKQMFSPTNSDPMFRGKFDDVDTYFVLYTPLKENFERKLSGNKQVCSKLHDIINTCEKNNNDKNKSKLTDIFQFDYEDLDVDILTTFIREERIKSLGKVFLEFILSNKKHEVMMSNDLIKIYHPALAQKVISISKVEAAEISKDLKTPMISSVQNNLNKPNISNYFHMGVFRPDFFHSDDYNLIILKNTFFQEIVYTHSSKTDLSKEELKRKIQYIADNPCPETISTIIGSPIKFDDTTDKLCLDINKLPKNKYKQDEIQQIRYDLQKIQVTRTIVNNAVHLAGQKALENLTFQLPQSFGNIDFTTNKKTEEDVQNRLNFIAGKFYSLINHFAEQNRDKRIKIIDISSDVVGPDKILELTHLNSNGGIGGAVGNLLEFDTQNELYTFNTGVLSKNAKYILEKLKAMVDEDINNYKVNVIMDGFPRMNFDTYKYDKNIAAQFLSKLWFYTNQAQEESVETTLKNEINMHYNADKQRNQFLFHVHSDAIFLRFHDEIQKWWKKLTTASYLTKTTNIFNKAKKDIVDNPLLTVLNVMFMRRIKNIGVDYTADAMDCLNIEEFVGKVKNQILNIVSDALVLTAAKMMQSKKHGNNFSFINLDYIDILPEDDHKTMMKELEQVKDMTLVIISETPLGQSLRDTLLDILSHFNKNDNLKNQIIIITNEPVIINQPDILRIKKYNVIHTKDNNVDFIDLTTQSQTVILNKCTITYQGQEIKLNMFLDENSKELINARLLWSLLNKDKIEVGHSLNTHKYNEIKNYYINRNLKRDGEEYAVGTLDDIDDKIVLISSTPCMGKTILLTHLSLETKKVDPRPWIVRINLSIHDKDIEALKYHDDINTVMAFLCKAALKNPAEIKKGNFTNIDNQTVAFNCTDSDDVSFELQLFIHSYNTDNVIFLFDGFDKIYPQYTNEGIKLFTSIKQANKRMWITSDYYVMKVLEPMFGSSYKIERLSTLQQKSFLQRFWSTNLKLEKLNHDQINNLALFINYIRRTFNYELLELNEAVDDRPVMPILSVPLHYVYLSVLEYFKNDCHSLSSCYFREKIKKKWRLNSYTSVDHYLRAPDKEQSLTLTGTPLHMYIAANYFIFQATDSKFNFNVNAKTLLERTDTYLDVVLLYQQFLNVNMKHICEIENKAAIREKNQEKLRDNFLDAHKKLALYAIFKESDIEKILTESEICEVKNTIKMIESGELKTHFIDSVVDGIPRFYHMIFAEYFVVETLSDLLKGIKHQNLRYMQIESICDFIVNIILCVSPPSLRHMFEYKLKYDPELAETASDGNCNKIVFNLLLKANQANNASTFDTDNALDIAINEGLANVTNFLLKCVRPNVNKDNVDKFKTIVKSSASILQVTDTSRKILSENVLKFIQNVDGENIIDILNSNDVGTVLKEEIKAKIVEPIKTFAGQLLEFSENNENLVTLMEQLPYHLPEFVRQFNENK